MSALEIAGVVSLLFIVVKFLFRKIRRAERIISNAMNIKPHIVGDMIARMGVKKSQSFVEDMLENTQESRQIGAVCLLVYHTFFKDSSEENIKWWHDRLVEQGFDPRLHRRHVDHVYLYFKDAGINLSSIVDFADAYNEAYCPLAPFPSTIKL